MRPRCLFSVWDMEVGFVIAILLGDIKVDDVNLVPGLADVGVFVSPREVVSAHINKPKPTFPTL